MVEMEKETTETENAVPPVALEHIFLASNVHHKYSEH
jgi:hypothetical protein